MKISLEAEDRLCFATERMETTDGQLLETVALSACNFVSLKIPGGDCSRVCCGNADK